MRQIAEEKLLPADIDAQPPVQAAAALRSVIRGYRDEIEREQRLPKALVEQFHAAGFYSLVMPRALGGRQADPLTYVRVVELLAEGAGSVGWNVANNSIGQLVTLGLSDEGVHEIYARGADAVIAGTAVMGGGRAVPVDGGYRVTGRWPFGTGCQESSWMLGSFQILDGDQPRRSPDGASIYWRGGFPRSEGADGEGGGGGSRGPSAGSVRWTVAGGFPSGRGNTVAAGEDTTLDQRARCRLAAVYAADSAREAMDLMYRHGGSTSYRRESRLAECWRDLHVVGQAVTLAPEWYPMGGRVLLKMDPGPRLR